jgi:pyruvate/2-oxoglutarate dehydrogenase complex dihydrolipoamide acyltransferase (E2) component
MDVTLPKWGMTMQEAVVVEWLVAVGDPVTEGQPVVRVESDKVDAEVESPGSGRLSEIVVPDGETAEVGAVLGRLESTGG